MTTSKHPSSATPQGGQTDDLLHQVGKKEARKLRAQREHQQGIWFWLGMVGLVGWSVALPTMIGIALGVWIDRAWPSRYSWTLMLLFLGVVIGCMHAWLWVRQESERD